MSKKVSHPSDETIYSIHKTLNVFSIEDFQKEYLLLIRKVFGISAAAAKLYQHIYESEKVDKFVYVDQKELKKKFAGRKKMDVSAAFSELIANGLISESGEEMLFCMHPEQSFDPVKYESIKFTFTIAKKLALTAGEDDVEYTEVEEQDTIKESAGKDIEEIKLFLKETFAFTDNELEKMNEAFNNKNINSEIFYKKIEEWKVAMPSNSTKAQKKNYLSACLLNEEWKVK